MGGPSRTEPYPQEHAVPATPTPLVLGDIPSVRAVHAPVASQHEPQQPQPEPTHQPPPDLTPTEEEETSAASPTPVVLRYVFPVRGEPISYGPYHHDYPAADIFCPIGSDYLATTSGVVEFVNRVDQWNPATDVPADRGGIMMSFVGDDGVRYYGSHLSSIVEGIEPGVRVEAGQLLGHTGNSGNARSTPPHLHYGISRPTTPDDWVVRRGEVPPYEYLKAWERGEAVTPRLPSVVPPPPPTPVPPHPNALADAARRSVPRDAGRTGDANLQPRFLSPAGGNGRRDYQSYGNPC
ncbi:MAG: peptidoglycan DD-metalloendopeptidase family protein [Chloroflexaceae bacterium]|nr:peptidoglycan DD-metalloendopeptidase family protein [Chloroflexaceae bacterium]